MVLNKEEKEIINRAFEQLPFVVSKYFTFPSANPLDTEAKEYVSKASSSDFPELFDEKGEANIVVDKKSAEEVLKICSFFEHCREIHKKETLQDKRQQIHVFSAALPYLDDNNKRIAEEYIKGLERDLPENVQARNAAEAEKAIKRMSAGDYFASFDVDNTMKAFGGNIPESIAKIYDDAVVDVSLRRISSMAEAENIVYIMPAEFDSFIKFSKKAKPESQQKIQDQFAVMMADQLEKSYKLLAAKNEELKGHKDDYRYNKDREILQQSALRYTHLFCEYAEVITQKYGSLPKTETLCNYAVKMAGIAYPPRSAKYYKAKAFIHGTQSEAYKKVQNNPLAELYSKSHDCDCRLAAISADLAIYSRADRDSKIARRVDDRNIHDRIMEEKRRISEQIKIYISTHSNKGRSNV